MIAEPASPQPNVFSRRASPSLRFWVVAVLTGVGAGLGGAALMALLRAIQHLAWSYESGDFLTAVRHVTFGHRVAVVMCAGVVAAIALVLIRKFLRSGPGLSSAIWFHSGRLPLARTLANAVLSIVVVALGASLGRESAPKEVGSAVGSALSQRLGLSAAQCRLLVACGAGAGMAAVYNVPLGGALFALEVLLGSLALPLVLPALVTSLIATAIAWLVIPAQPSFEIPRFVATPSLVVWALAFGPIAGVASVAFVRVMFWAGAHAPKTPMRTLLVSLSVFFLVGFAAIPFPEILGNGRNIVALAFEDKIGVGLLAALLLAKLAATAGCIGTGAPGGLFMPTMSFGALLGGLAGRVASDLLPAQQVGSFAVIGAAAVLAATTQGPVSATVLVLELTYRADGLVVPMLLAVAGATLVAGALESRSIYSGRISLNTQTAVLAGRRVSTPFDELLTCDYGVICASQTYTAALERFANLSRGPLYVLDEKSRVTGVIERVSIDRPMDDIGLPLVSTTVSDLKRTTAVVDSEMTAAEVKERLSSLGVTYLPVVDRTSGLLIGVVERHIAR